MHKPNRLDVAINDIANALADLNVPRSQRVAIFERSIQSVVDLAIAEHEFAQLTGIRDDLSRVEQIRVSSGRQHD